MEIKSMDDAGIEFLIKEEGLVLHPYLDSVGVPTIGIGCTWYPNGNKVKMTDPAITKEQAIELFRTVLKHYETAVWSVTKDYINQNQFNALCSLCYNIGVNGFKSSTVVKLVNTNTSDPKIKDAFLMWKKPSQLIPRRKREIELFFK